MVVFLLNTAFFSGCGGEGFCFSHAEKMVVLEFGGAKSSLLYPLNESPHDFKIGESSGSHRNLEKKAKTWYNHQGNMRSLKNNFHSVLGSEFYHVTFMPSLRKIPWWLLGPGGSKCSLLALLHPSVISRVRCDELIFKDMWCGVWLHSTVLCVPGCCYGSGNDGSRKKRWAVCRDGRKRMQGKQNWTDS